MCAGVCVQVCRCVCVCVCAGVCMYCTYMGTWVLFVSQKSKLHGGSIMSIILNIGSKNKSVSELYTIFEFA